MKTIGLVLYRLLAGTLTIVIVGTIVLMLAFAAEAILTGIGAFGLTPDQVGVAISVVLIVYVIGDMVTFKAPDNKD